MQPRDSQLDRLKEIAARLDRWSAILEVNDKRMQAEIARLRTWNDQTRRALSEPPVKRRKLPAHVWVSLALFALLLVGLAVDTLNVPCWYGDPSRPYWNADSWTCEVRK